jgi:hypothetical protein
MNIWTHLSNLCPDLCPIIFNGDVSPINVVGYIHRFHVTDKHIVIFIGINE